MTQKHKMNKCPWENSNSSGFAHHQVATDLQFVLKNKKKKAHNLQRAVKQSIVKQSMPVMGFNDGSIAV